MKTRTPKNWPQEYSTSWTQQEFFHVNTCVETNRTYAFWKNIFFSSFLLPKNRLDFKKKKENDFVQFVDVTLMESTKEQAEQPNDSWNVSQGRYFVRHKMHLKRKILVKNEVLNMLLKMWALLSSAVMIIHVKGWKGNNFLFILP